MTKSSYADECLERAEKCSSKKWTFVSEGDDVKGSQSVEAESGFNLLSVGWDESVDHRFDDADLIDMSALEMEFVAHARTDVPELARRLKVACIGLCKAGYDELADELEATGKES